MGRAWRPPDTWIEPIKGNVIFSDVWCGFLSCGNMMYTYSFCLSLGPYISETRMLALRNDWLEAFVYDSLQARSRQVTPTEPGGSGCSIMSVLRNVQGA